jgi:lipopolysaccharide biosynthesis glycosyltransferase
MTAPDGPITIALAADEPFAIPLAVTGRSIIASHTSATPVRIHIIDLGLTAQTQKRLERSWEAPGISVHFQRADLASLGDLPVWGRMGLGTYVRLLMGTLLPAEWSRVIWLDSDLVVERDLSELWATPVNGKTLVAAQDMVVPFVASRFGVEDFAEQGMAPNTPHFNAGVMLVDLTRWRSQDIAGSATEYLKQAEGRVWFWDQQALNVVLRAQWSLLDPRWNVVAGVAGKSFFHPDHLDHATYQHCISDPWITHWAGSIKPWAFLGKGVRHDRWRELLDQTDWAGWRPPATMRSRALRIYDAKIRRLTYPLEQWPLRLQRFLGRRK